MVIESEDDFAADEEKQAQARSARLTALLKRAENAEDMNEAVRWLHACIALMKQEQSVH